MAKKPQSAKKRPRRPLKSRGQGWAKAWAALFIRLRLSPNAISLAGFFVACAGGALLSSGPGGAAAWLAAACCVQLRLFCNLMDGMVAIEGGLKAKNGEIFNEVPDRLADLALLVGAGYSLPFAWGPALGWACGAAALLTAYVRLFGGSLGLEQDFRGPQAKPHRMALLTLGCLASALAQRWQAQGPVMAVTLGLILAGTLATFLRRLWAINRALLAG